MPVTNMISRLVKAETFDECLERIMYQLGADMINIRPIGKGREVKTFHLRVFDLDNPNTPFAVLTVSGREVIK